MTIHDKSMENYLMNSSSTIDLSDSFTVTWSSLTYRCYPTAMQRLTNSVKGDRSTFGCKTILQNCNGSFRSGRLTAIMGPSGSGKSTLLECLAGVRKVDQVDNIRLHGPISHVSLSFIPQQDQLFERLTVREVMTYAARLHFVSRQKTDYGKIKTEIDQILTQLNIFDCVDQIIENLSGGQKGRLSIAQELIASPEIIMMDEPTSGLDSSSSYSLIELLVKLASSLSIAIVITIHQPSARLFNLLQDVYMFSYNGKFMFEGKPDQVTSTLNAVGIKFDSFNNPADVLLDVANGEYGIEVIETLTKKVSNKNNQSYPWKKDKPLASCLMNYRGAFKDHLCILISRQCLISIRDRLSILLKYSVAISLALLVGISYYNIGKSDGCLTEQIRTWLNLDKIGRLFERITESSNKTRDHVGAFFFLFVFISITAALSPAAALPFYAKAIRKECSNNWYGRTSFIVAFIIADLPFLILSVTLSYAIFFILSNQPLDRFFSSLFIYILAAMNTQARGVIFGSLFIDNMLSSVLLSPNSTIYDTLLSGFLIRIKELPRILQIFSSISFARISMDGVIVAIFGFKRCTIDLSNAIEVTLNRMIDFLDTNFKIARITIQRWTSEYELQALKNSTDSIANVFKDVYKSHLDESADSSVMRQFNLTDSIYTECVCKLLVLCLITQIFAVIAFTWRGCRKK
ncbi:ATP-binding cassette sub-family G member 1-like [Tetranychus urticae]|uniref:ABC transporter domain-containing protein n=1 Tax=Tetranychus urticae TaxID=32264 RepID=T1JZL3_TETUR|nr:ATP-binding cassette sub-family G member 1-like [Tetranychus urticae]